MKDNYDTAFKLVVGHEGGFTNDRNDRGNWTSGVIGKGTLRGTKYGISAMSYPTTDIKNLTLDQAKEIYRTDFWNKAQCDLMPIGVDYLLFDASVNHGVSRANRFLQEALGVTADGKIVNGRVKVSQRAV
jgi:lysozyme family protein